MLADSQEVGKQKGASEFPAASFHQASRNTDFVYWKVYEIWRGFRERQDERRANCGGISFEQKQLRTVASDMNI